MVKFMGLYIIKLATIRPIHQNNNFFSTYAQKKEAAVGTHQGAIQPNPQLLYLNGLK